MDTTTSLFARAQPRVNLPRKQKRSGALSFLDLPGEIRNRIYQYYFQDTYRCELVGSGCDLSANAPKTIKLIPNNGTSKRYRGGQKKGTEPEKPIIMRFSRRYDRRTTHCNPAFRAWIMEYAALVLVCKQIHSETLSLLYRCITFVIAAPRRIMCFLRNVPKPSHSHITKLHLYYTTYGSPEAACDVIWQDKHIASWTRACRAAAKSLTCLRELEVDVWISEHAPKFNLRQKWLQPLWQFRRLTCNDSYEDATGSMTVSEGPHSLTTVYVRVKTHLFTNDFGRSSRLANACKHLHRLYGHGISKAILGAKEEEAMSAFEKAWGEKYHIWQHHLGFAKTGW